MKLKQVRKEKKVSRRRLADAIDVTEITIMNWETGKTSPKLCDLSKAADELGVDIIELI